MSNSTFLYKKNGDLFVFGNNYSGQLGLGDNKDRNKPTLLLQEKQSEGNNKDIKMISCGEYHSMIYCNNGDLFVFGYNYNGQLGLGDNINRNKPTLLMQAKQSEGNNKDIKMISCGGFHSMIYYNNGDLFVFGYNEDGQLGLGDNIDRNVPTLLMQSKQSEGNNKDIKMISCGYQHSMIYCNNGDLFVFGDNEDGQLGLGDEEDRNVPTLLLNNKDIKMISCGGYHSMIYYNNGDLFVFGNNNRGQLGLGDNNHRNKPTLFFNNKDIKTICCGRFHSMMYYNNGDLFVFGNNNDGQLGLGDNKDRNKPTLLMNNKDIKMISCGSYHSMIYCNNGDLFIFGSESNKNKPTLLINDPSIININGISIDFEWSPDNHKYYSDSFKLEIKLLYLCLKRIQNLTQLKIPKFVIYEIIKFI